MAEALGLFMRCTLNDYFGPVSLWGPSGCLPWMSGCFIADKRQTIPLQSRIESVSDESDLDEVYATERHLLYVAFDPAIKH